MGIRPLREKDIEQLVKIWLEGCLKAHNFISKEYWESKKVTEKGLLEFIKQEQKIIHLKVYQKNKNAVEFYLNNGFAIKEESMDKQTLENEYLMVWKKNIGS